MRAGHTRPALSRSFELLLDPGTGLLSDNVSAAGERSRYTSPTNVGAYLWSALAARDAGIVSEGEARQRIAATLASVARLERHGPSGMFYNWYDPASGTKLTTWPVDGNPVYPFLSSVDNGWMAAALLMVSNAVPELRGQARDLLAPMDFGAYYDPAAGVTRTYLDVEVFEGHYRYRGMDIVPSWGGSMFEALMVPLLVPEAR